MLSQSIERLKYLLKRPAAVMAAIGALAFTGPGIVALTSVATPAFRLRVMAIGTPLTHSSKSSLPTCPGSVQ